MKWLITILFLIPFLCKSQDVQTIEVCEGALSTQEYWVDDGPNTYYWSVENGDIINGQGSNSITIEWGGVPYGQYLLNVSIISNIGCIGDTSYLIIDIDDCSFDGIYIPNTFTPNDDGINDIFIPVSQNIDRLELFIYNRWGQQIYESYEGNAWDGTLYNEMCQMDVYIWKVNYKFINENITHYAYGHVTLIR